MDYYFVLLYFSVILAILGYYYYGSGADIFNRSTNVIDSENAPIHKHTRKRKQKTNKITNKSDDINITSEDLKNDTNEESLFEENEYNGDYEDDDSDDSNYNDDDDNISESFRSGVTVLSDFSKMMTKSDEDFDNEIENYSDIDVDENLEEMSLFSEMS
jgi:hypothetical protein